MTDAYKDTIRQVRDAAASALSTMVDDALGHAMLALHQQHGREKDENKMLQARSSIVKRFTDIVSSGFDRLLDHGIDAKSRSLDFDSLSLVDEDIQEAYIALEGMATHARNCDIREYLRFTVRINAQFYNARVDESNNPLDPGRLAESFKHSMRPVELGAESLLDVYRKFNLHVFHQMGKVMMDINELLAKTGVAPNLENLGRTKKAVANRRGRRRERVDANSRAFRTEEDPTPLSEPAGTEPDMLKVLVELLHKSKESKQSNDSAAPAGKDSGDPEPSEVTALVKLLFQAIEEDLSLPEAPRKLLVQAQASILQLTHDDPSFFNQADHPARQLLNEVAATGISWTHTDQLQDDQLYQKACEAITTLVKNSDGDQSPVESLLAEFLSFKKLLADREFEYEMALTRTDSTEQRKDEINRYAKRKISERIADSTIPPLIKNLLDNHYRKFLVEVILRDGPGGDSWKPVMDTLDLLLWSVSTGRTQADREKLDKVSPKLISNLDKVLKIAGASKEERESLLSQLQALQEKNFSAQPKPVDEGGVDLGKSLETETTIRAMDEYADSLREQSLQDVKRLAIGMWFEFDVDESHKIRCTLASKIPSICSYIFINRQGIKVLELTEAELANDLQTNTARLINDGNLIDRAIDTVIANLRATVEKLEKPPGAGS